MCKMMELYIETLTGTAFELRVSPYETVQDVKSRIQKLEGIPVSQQHLIWQNHDLEDDYSLQDYSIHDGATLKLVLTMRGGPINTRRIPVEDPTIREMAEYLSEANRDDIMEKVPGNRPVTVIVYHNGDQLNFFRVVDRDSASPLSDSISGASMYNLYDDEEDEDSPGKETVAENDKMREKMLQLRMKMENMTVTKKPRKPKMVPRPPSQGRPSSKSKIRRFPSYSGKKPGNLLKTVLPPVVGTSEPESTVQHALEGGHHHHLSSGSETPVTAETPGITAKESSASLTVASASSIKGAPPLKLSESREESAKVKPALASVKEDPGGSDHHSVINSSSGPRRKPADASGSGSGGADSFEGLLKRQQVASSRSIRGKLDFSAEVLLKDGTSAAVPKPPASPRKSQPRAIPSSAAAQKGLERLLENQGSCETAGGPGGGGRPSTSSHRELTLEQFKESLARPPTTTTTTTSTRYTSAERKQRGVILESLHPSEVPSISGMLSNLVRSASRSRGYTLSSAALKEMGRISTPEGRHLSARLQRLSASRDGRMSPSHRLPPVKQKKKSTKRCFLCGKKTSLATSYQCRCGNNFCATHRYAEAHECDFDYKTEGRKLLEQSNPVVTAPKLPKI